MGASHEVRAIQPSAPSFESRRRDVEQNLGHPLAWRRAPRSLAGRCGARTLCALSPFSLGPTDAVRIESADKRVHSQELVEYSSPDERLQVQHLVCREQVSLFEFEPLPASELPRITGADQGLDAAGLWSADVHSDLVEPGPEFGTRQLHVYFPKPLVVSGLEVFWNASRRSARLEGLDQSGEWRLMGEDSSPLGDTSYLAANTAPAFYGSELNVDTNSNAPSDAGRKRLSAISTDGTNGE